MIWYVLLAAFALGWAFFGWWSWRTVRRIDGRSDLALLRRLPRAGMGIFGLGAWPVTSLMQVLESLQVSPAQALGMPNFYGMLALNLAIAYPVWIWGDFLFRRGMGWVFGIPVRPASPSAAAD